ncbi:MAG: heme A synthase [Actinomycetia bacterium]|nr:heme A synthase [Actinomycetes bacterium]
MILGTDQSVSRARWVGLNDPITRWLLMVAVLVATMVVVGGYVRLSRAGLSITEWDVVTGVIPPIGDVAWEQSFADYQQTPEYQLINRSMTLAEYQRIFYIEWAHRLIARIAGLLVVLPLFWFLWKGRLSWRSSLRYWAITILFGVQGILGWIMVSSGLRDRPAVSHFRLTVHLLTALLLLGIVLWFALDRMDTGRAADRCAEPARRSRSHTLAWALLGAVVVQIAFGGLVAGLKAGHVSNTWPLMFGRLVPPGLLAGGDEWWLSLFEPISSHWIHRWLAFVVAAIGVAVFVVVRRDHPGSDALRIMTSLMLIFIGLQITMGVLVVLMNVQKWMALTHQGIGVGVFCISVGIAHRVHSRWGHDAALVTPQPSRHGENAR